MAVVIPAHDEEMQIGALLDDLSGQLGPSDLVIVVADNCSDRTAEIAAQAGANVVRRSDPTRIGKGFALQAGVDSLPADRADILVFIDADCRVSAGAIHKLALTVAASGRPTQGLYLMKNAEGSGRSRVIAEFAWRLRNWTRPLGMSALGLPCQITGSGFAIPAPIAKSTRFASSRLAEDLELGLELARAGHAADFCERALITSEFTDSDAGNRTQRHRWMRGHLDAIRRQVIPTLLIAACRPDVRLAALAADVLVPPFVVMAICVAALTFVAAGFALIGAGNGPLLLALASATLLAAGLFCGWVHAGRDLTRRLTLGDLTYFASNAVSLLPQVFSLGATSWIRTTRSPSRDAE